MVFVHRDATAIELVHVWRLAYRSRQLITSAESPRRTTYRSLTLVSAAWRAH